MATATVSVPEDLKRAMSQFPTIDWDEVARKAIRERASELALLKAIASKSNLTEKDALDIGRKVNKGLANRYL